MTLCFIVEDSRILLGYKKIGLGAGRWNGFGGKVKPGEDVGEAMVRETREESGLVPLRYEKQGILKIRNDEKSEPLEIHVFRALEYQGDVRETDEMLPAWHDIEKLPYDGMWPDDRIWMPAFLAGRKFLANVILKDQSEILSNDLKIVASL
jgi:8-oxo-dGTP pyrophosphatase MutT (NUDIX family)